MVSTAGQLLERERELGRIGELLDRARAGAGGLALVDGPAGIGKTRLARAARQEAELRGFLALAGRGAALERDYPFGVVRQLLEPPLRRATDGERARLLEGAAALAAPVVLPDEVFESGRSDPAFGTLHGLFWLCANLAERQPLLLVADDLQWVDEPSVRFLGFLLRRIEALPIFVLATRRSGGAPSLDLDDDPLAEQLSLRPLSAAAVASFLRLRADGPVAEEFALACHDATGGNPLLLEQVVRALRERRVAFTAASVDAVERVAPDAVSAAVLARLGRLAPAAKVLAPAAAVLGDDSALALAAELAGISEAEAAEAAAELARAGVFEDARPLRFEHPIVRSAVESSLTAGERERLHRHAAELLEKRGAPVDQIAVHLLPTDPRGRAAVVETLAEAARRAVTRGAPEAAIPILVRALAEPPAVDRRVRLLLALGRAEGSLARPQAVEHLLEAHRLAIDPVERGTCALQLGWAHMLAQSHTDGIDGLIDEAIAEAEPVDRELALELEAVRGALLSTDNMRGGEGAARLERFADLEGRTRAECALLGHLAHFRMDRGSAAAAAADLAERAVANDDIVADVGFDAAWLVSSVLVLLHADRFEPAMRALTVALDAARLRGAVGGFAIGSTLRARLLLDVGKLPAAEAEARAALEVDFTQKWTRLPAAAMLVDALVESARPEEAEQLLLDYKLDGTLPDVRPATVLLLSRAALRADRGQLEPALEDLEMARRRLARFTGETVVGLDGRLRGTLIRHRLGDTHEARQEARNALTVARHWGTHSWIGNALRVDGIVTGGDDGLALLHEAVDSLGRSPRRLDHARALVDLGAALRRRGDRVAARDPLRNALGLAHECGATATRERARQELAASGVRVRREAQTGLDSLTPSERRIAERAAAGESNREIAQALFITVKTVEMHLGHAYRKLGITSRNELVLRT